MIKLNKFKKIGRKIENFCGFQTNTKIINKKRYIASIIITGLFFIVFLNWSNTSIATEYYQKGVLNTYELDQQNCTMTMTVNGEIITKTFKGLEDLPGLLGCLKNQGGEYQIPAGEYDNEDIEKFRVG